MIATAGAVLAWLITEWSIKGKPSMLGAASGAAGLVGITPAAGLVGPAGRAGHRRDRRRVVRVWGVNGLKRILRADDSLDVFGARRGRHRRRAADRRVQCPGPGPGLAEPGMIAHQLWVQLEGVLLTIVWSGVVALIAYKIANALCAACACRKTRSAKG